MMMVFRPTHALPLFTTVTLLLLSPNCPAVVHSPPEVSAGLTMWQWCAADDSGFELYTLAPDDEPLGDPPSPPTSSNKPPVIRNLTHTIAGTLVTFSGKVEDEAPGGLTVRFGGRPMTNNATTITDASGNFTFTIDLGGRTGEVWARTTDGEGLDSGYVYVNVN